MCSFHLIRTAAWLGLVYAAALACALFLLLDDLKISAGLILIPWMAGPVALAAAGVRISRTVRAARGFIALQLLIIASTVIVWADMISVHLDALNGVAMGIVLPLYQYGAVIVLWCAAYLFGWRTRFTWRRSDVRDHSADSPPRDR